MATREFVLNETAVKELERAEQSTRQVGELRRMQAVRLYGTGQGMDIITQVTQASERTVRRWVARYSAGGINGLRECWQGGNNRKLTRAQRAEIKAKLQQYRPVDLHISQSLYWTVSDLQTVVEDGYGVVYREGDSYQALLHESGFSYQRSAKVYRSKPSAADVAQFEAELEKK
jgi:putative transposase